MPSIRLVLLVALRRSQNAKCKIENGKWKMENGKWKTLPTMKGQGHVCKSADAVDRGYRRDNWR
jgi:hypothetical protein